MSETELTGLVFHTRCATADCPAGFTVSKSERLPEGDFVITEYSWGDIVLWFVDDDCFTDDERQAAYDAYVTAFDGGPA